MNDFENSLRDSLQRAVPAAPEEPNRSEGARAYAASARRRRTGVLAVGAAAVVVAAIVVVPSVVERSDRGIAPAVGPPQTQAPKQTGELPDQPFECPSRGGPDQSMDTPPDGTIDPGAVLVRVCAAQEGTPWIPPLDALTSDVESITQAFNGLAVAEDRMPCTEEFGPAYLMVFQYPDGHAVQVRGDLYGCRLVSFGALERQGADEALSAYFDALQAQRVKTGPILDGEPLSCPDPSFSSVDTLMPVTLEDPGLTRVTVCRYSTDGALIRQSVLNEAEVADVSADLASNTTTSSDLKLCPPEAGGSTELIVRTSYGDVIAFQPQCDYFVSFGSPDQFWQPTPATLELIESAVR